MERLQKVLAASNIASRRKAEDLIASGRVKVNDIIIIEQGFKVSDKDSIKVDDKEISRATKCYYLLNKPPGYISAVSDDLGRKTILDLFSKEDLENRIYPIGRLDYMTSGLLLVTNDGTLSDILSSPKSKVEKEYLVRVEGIVIRKKIQSLRRNGIDIGNYIAKPKDVRIAELNCGMQTTLLSITLTEGKNLEVRKICEAMGHKVLKLTRIRYDFLRLDVEKGSYRNLKIHEIKKLYQNKKI